MRGIERTEEYESLNPIEMWMEDRWTFVRRMLGDKFTQKLFIRCIIWIYVNNDIKRYDLRE